jgi:hypothetical protein
MLPSARLFLNRDAVYASRVARRHAEELYDEVQREAEEGLEPVRPPWPPAPDISPVPQPRAGRLLRRRRQPGPGQGDSRSEHRWGKVAAVAEDYPRLYAWLAEGQVSPLWNVFGLVIGIARLVPGIHWLLWRFMFVPVAQHAPWRAALRAAILQELRNDRNKEKARHGTRLVIRGTAVPGLSAVTDVSVITPTGPARELRQKIAAMSSGCIGVSGPRGSGKSALIRDFCAHRYGTPDHPAPDDTRLAGLRVLIHAPLRFDAREYLVHQYACLCRAVLADVRFNPTTLLDHLLGPVLFPRPLRLSRLLGVLSGIALACAFGVLVYLLVNDGRAPHWNVHAWEVAGAVVTAAGALALACWRTRWAVVEVRQIVNLASDAERRLERLQFLRTDTRTGGAKLAGPAGIGVSVGSSHELAEQEMTLPELIDDYRDFVERIVAGLQQKQRVRKEERQRRHDRPERAGRFLRARGRKPPTPPGRTEQEADVRLVIGIDAVDQIDDPIMACRFLDELGAVFGTPRCVYVIAVSPATQAAIDQRTVPLKTSSSGLFDEMIWLRQLGLNDAGLLLDRRVVGLPAAFIALCYMLSGGLPRELLRVARALYTVPGRGRTGREVPREVSLAEAARHVIEQEISALKHRALASAVSSAEVSAAPDLLAGLVTPDWPFLGSDNKDSHLDGEAIGRLLSSVSALWAGDKRRLFTGPDSEDVAPYTAEVCDCLLADLYFLLTVRELCTVRPSPLPGLARRGASAYRPESGKDKGQWLDDDEPAFRYLAGARLALATSPYLAATLVDRARERLAELRPAEFKGAVRLSFLGTAPARRGPPARTTAAGRDRAR